jgi:SPP1 family predicted phage head-tail adaptor
VKVGRLQHIITIQSKAKTTDAYGGTIDTWSNLATVWASVEPLMGREMMAAQAAQSEITTRFRIRYLDGVDSTMRIVHKGVNYDIQAPPINVNEENRELIILASTGMKGV